MIPSFISERWGTKNFALNSSFSGFGPIIINYTLGVFVAGKFYQMAMPTGYPGNKCHGSHCFRYSFYMFTALNVLGYVGSLILTSRTNKMYVQLEKKKHHL